MKFPAAIEAIIRIIDEQRLFLARRGIPGNLGVKSTCKRTIDKACSVADFSRFCALNTCEPAPHPGRLKLGKQGLVRLFIKNFDHRYRNKSSIAATAFMDRNGGAELLLLTRRGREPREDRSSELRTQAPQEFEEHRHADLPRANVNRRDRIAKRVSVCLVDSPPLPQ